MRNKTDGRSCFHSFKTHHILDFDYGWAPEEGTWKGPVAFSGKHVPIRQPIHIELQGIIFSK